MNSSAIQKATGADVWAIIMAGGSGERFWPLSRISLPKQMLNIVSDKALLADAVERLIPLFGADRIMVITSSHLEQSVRHLLPDVPATNIIAEPAKRNTAPCLALAAAAIRTTPPTEATPQAMAVFTADHFIGNEGQFHHDVITAVRHSVEHQCLVTFGIIPTRPDTGFGYIEVAEKPEGRNPVPVLAFREKPDAESAHEYLRSGRYYWNSGMFFWSVTAFELALVNHLPAVGSHLQAITAAIETANEADLTDIFTAMPSISIDYGVMEHADNVAVLPAGFAWDDVGSWDAMYRLRVERADTTAGKNVTIGDALVNDGEQCLVVNTHPGNHIVALTGISNIAVVVTADATLVCDIAKGQTVKDVVAVLRNRMPDVL